MAIQLKKCTLKDLHILKELSLITYTDTFGPYNPPEIMKAYLDEAYADEKLADELNDPLSEFYFLYEEEALAGYLKINSGEAQTEEIAENALEIERLYVHPVHKRKGFGRYLITQAIQFAVEKQNTSVWLGVWEHNEPAKAFYQAMGFQRQGEHSFFMGDDEQTDFIMVKTLEEA
ncbi:GNAT family N-acetyltransferase [Enterococcus olivae]